MSALYPYQRAGADWLKTRERGILGDGMGLGKTPQAIVAASELGLRRVAVVCPAIARGNWRAEFKTWAPEIEPVIVSYDDVAREPKLLSEHEWEVLILDEGQYLKTPKTKRVRAIYGADCRGGPAQESDRCWVLSGTIAPNNASELWTHFRALFGETRGFELWVSRYCSGYPTKWGRTITGNKRANLPELKEKLASVMLRRTGADVRLELPPISIGELRLERDVVEDIQTVLDFEAEMMRSEEMAKIYRRTGDMDLALLEASPHVSVLRRETGRAKAAAVAHYINEELLSGALDKVVLFAVHHDVLDTLARILAPYNPVRVDGRVPDKARNLNIRRFQNEPDCRVFIGQVQACGTAITLHAANQTVFVEQSWVPGENAQASKRCHRIGQKRPVFVRVASVAGTLDESIDRALARKTLALLELDNKAPTHEALS